MLDWWLNKYGEIPQCKGMRVFHVNPRFHTSSVAQNLGLIWKIPTPEDTAFICTTVGHNRTVRRITNRSWNFLCSSLILHHISRVESVINAENSRLCRHGSHGASRWQRGPTPCTLPTFQVCRPTISQRYLTGSHVPQIHPPHSLIQHLSTITSSQGETKQQEYIP